MKTHLAAQYEGTPEGIEGAEIISRCTHCGFCLATCPSYQILGSELDSPRGRIYQMKQILEGAEPTPEVQEHLDRCLTCLACETTCPSGVQYGHLLEIGRKIVEEKVGRHGKDKLERAALRHGLTSPLFASAMRAGQALRGAVPESLRAKVPERRGPGLWPRKQHTRKVLMLAGCVQPSMIPNINAATARVLDAAGIECVLPARQGCCGAVKYHLADSKGGLREMRHNIDVWWPYVESGKVEALVINASGCGAMVKEYGHALKDDPGYAEKAARISAATRDVSELLPELAKTLAERVRAPGGIYAWHEPCTLQHAQQLSGKVPQALATIGFHLRPAAHEGYLCCGAAGTYSILQPEISHQLRDRKLNYLQGEEAGERPVAILSANIGCITQLQSGTDIPVRHWIEVLDEALAPAT